MAPSHVTPDYDPPISDDPVSSLAAISAIPPPVSVNSSCHPPPLPPVPDCDNDPGLTGEHLQNPRKLVLMTLFSFEADTLEIMLREQQDLVDFIFIVEGSATHRGVSDVMIVLIIHIFCLFQVQKPLMWERLKLTPRFSFVNTSRVIHVVVDDAMSSGSGVDDVW